MRVVAPDVFGKDRSEVTVTKDEQSGQDTPAGWWRSRLREGCWPDGPARGS